MQHCQRHTSNDWFVIVNFFKWKKAMIEYVYETPLNTYPTLMHKLTRYVNKPN